MAVKWILPFFSAQDINHIRICLAAAVSVLYLFIWWIVKIFKKNSSESFLLFSKREFWLPPIFCGFLLYIFLALQTQGLAYTTVAKSGFITCLYVLFIPLLLFFIWKKRFSYTFFLYCSLSVVGVYLLMDANFDNFNYGDLLTLGCAFVGALHIIAVDRMAKNYHPILFNSLQCIVMGVMATMAVSFNEQWIELSQGLKQLDNLAIIGFIMIGIFSSFFAFAFQIYAQKTIAPHIVAVLFLLESPFAAVSGFFFLGEQLSHQSILGCFIVLLCAYQISRMSSKT